MFFSTTPHLERRVMEASAESFDVSAEWARLASEFQRHTVNANGVWNMRWGILLAELLPLRSGNYSTITSPADPLGQVNGARACSPT